MIVIGGSAAAYFGWITLSSFTIRAAIVAVAGILAIRVYARLLRIAAPEATHTLPWVHAAMAALSLSALLVSASVMVYGTRLIGILPFWMIPFLTGIALARAGWARRAGHSMHCPACEYEFLFNDLHKPPLRCPECGSAWLGRLHQGRKVRSPRVVALGIFIAIASLLILNPVFWINPLARYLPTPLLYASLYATPRSAYIAWDELSLRSLDPAWTRHMGERVLEMRHRSPHDRSPRKWFEVAAASGQMPPQLVERFYTEGFDASLQAPESAKAGEPFQVSLRVRSALHAESVLGVMFAGYAIDDAPPLVGRQVRTLWSHDLHPSTFSSEKNVCHATLRIDQPGDRRVRAVYWLSYQRSFSEALKWQDDGTPAVPPGAVWFRRIELQTTIRIDE